MFLHRCWRRVRIWDRCLLLILALLLLQSAASLFLPDNGAPTVTMIDVIVRTASAAIFGYLLGRNFAQDTPGNTSAAAPLPEALAPSDSSATGARAQIGFSAGEATRPAPAALTPTPESGCRVQVLVAAGVGLFCLVALLVLRNLVQAGVITELSESANATVSQFRDFVSGCVGLLIGSPVRTPQSNS